MPIVKWDPFRRMAILQEQINRLFDDSFAGPDSGNDDLAVCAWQPVVDIYETEKDIILMADMPGVKSKDLTIDLRDDTLTLSGDIEPFEHPDEQDMMIEYEVGKFYRQFTLSEVIDQSKIDANLGDGVLRLVLHKVEKAKPRRIEVKAG